MYFDRRHAVPFRSSYCKPDPIDLPRRSAGLTTPASPPGEPLAARPQDSAAQLSTGADTGRESDAAADPSDDDRLSLLGGDDGALSAASGSDGAGLGRPTAGARAGRRKARLGKPGKFIPLKMCVPAHLARPKKREFISASVYHAHLRKAIPNHSVYPSNMSIRCAIALIRS